MLNTPSNLVELVSRISVGCSISLELLTPLTEIAYVYTSTGADAYAELAKVRLDVGKCLSQWERLVIYTLQLSTLDSVAKDLHLTPAQGQSEAFVTLISQLDASIRALLQASVTLLAQLPAEQRVDKYRVILGQLEYEVKVLDNAIEKLKRETKA